MSTLRDASRVRLHAATSRTVVSSQLLTLFTKSASVISEPSYFLRI
jgi:hypothetical protein